MRKLIETIITNNTLVHTIITNLSSSGTRFQKLQIIHYYGIPKFNETFQMLIIT